MNRRVFIIMALAGIALTGCRKEEDEQPDRTIISLQNLKASDSFSWTTGKNVALSITGLPTTIPIESTLRISLPDGSVLLERLHRMDENVTLHLTMPSSVSLIHLTFGTDTHLATVTNGQAFFSFIPAIQE